MDCFDNPWVLLWWISDLFCLHLLGRASIADYNWGNRFAGSPAQFPGDYHLRYRVTDNAKKKSMDVLGTDFEWASVSRP